MIEKFEMCPECGEVKRWLYDAQVCAACGHGKPPDMSPIESEFDRLKAQKDAIEQRQREQEKGAFIILWERSAGNAETGNAWIETAVFPATATLSDVRDWLASREPFVRNIENCWPILGNGGRVILQSAQYPKRADEQ